MNRSRLALFSALALVISATAMLVLVQPFGPAESQAGFSDAENRTCGELRENPDAVLMSAQLIADGVKTPRGMGADDKLIATFLEITGTCDEAADEARPGPAIRRRLPATLKGLAKAADKAEASAERR